MKSLIYLALVLSFLSCNIFNIFDEVPKKIAEIELGPDYPKLFVFKSESNASTNESIQLRTELDSNNAIAIFERYDLMMSYKVMDSKLSLVLKDTSGHKIKTDTIFFDLRSIK